MRLTSPLTIHVDAEAAEAFREASDETRHKLEIYLGLQIRTFVSLRPGSLTEVMDRMGREAEANGMTPEILESILNDGR